MKKRILCLLLLLVLLGTMLPQLRLAAHAEVLSGYCGAEGDGSSLTWGLDTETGILSRQGSGKMQKRGFGKAPWYNAGTCTDPGVMKCTCTICGYATTKAIQALGHDSQAVMTEAAATEGGYTTWICSRCGDSYVDSHTDLLGTDYTVTFSVLGDTNVIAPLLCNTQTGVTLPEAEAPEGWRFLGWVEQDYDNVAVQPEDILTGAYTAQNDVTLLALFTWNDYGGKPPKLEKMAAGDDFADGDKIVIVESGGAHGLYQKKHNYAYVSDFDFTEDAEAILADELRYFHVTKVDDGWYLGDEVNGWLYTPDNTTNLTIRDNTAFMTAFTLTTLDGHLALQHTVSYNDNVFYVNCATNINGALQNKWRMVNANNMSGVSTLDIYKLIEGGPAVARYTTMLHTHSPGEPVRENEAAPTCTDPGGYDLVTYCTVCGAELSREHIKVEAIGHDWGEWCPVPMNFCTDPRIETRTCNRCGATENRTLPPDGHVPGEPVKENETAPTCTEPGGYDLVVYCIACGEELSREHTEIAAAGHHFENGVCTVCGAADPDYEPDDLENPFVDVAEGVYYYDAVLWAVGHDPQITKGTDATHFSPDAKCTRGQVVTFLWRAKGSPEPEALKSVCRDGNLPSADERGSSLHDMREANPFSDVKEDDYFYKAVLWAVENEITTGTGGGKFSPSASCTRGQVVTFLWRTEGKPEPEAHQSMRRDKPCLSADERGSSLQHIKEAGAFTDVDKNAYYYTAVLWAVEKNITQGTGGGKFSPNASCTRGQIVTFLYRDLA